MIILVFLPDLLPKKKEQEKMADENEKLKAELEALKEQISQETEKIKAESLEKTDETAK